MRDLPAELLLEILLELDLESIFMMRGVRMHRLALFGATEVISFLGLPANYGVSKARSPWLTLLERLQDELPGLCCATPYHTFDAAELEQPPEVFGLEESYARYLVPGGRWLISGLRDGSSRLVYTYLESHSSGPFDLLRHPNPEFRGDVRRIALYLVTESDAFAFTFAVTYVPPVRTESDFSTTDTTTWA
ncbi:hypothetical protein FS837_002909 [Tulasnella sp. UAMH 9824]|nr:hypothetical protein FS837_002909 [Tulasnella sp. UAMH 9824]